MEIIIKFSEEGKFLVEKSDNMAVFTAVGMLELAKKLILEKGDKDVEEVTEEVDTDEIV